MDPRTDGEAYGYANTRAHVDSGADVDSRADGDTDTHTEGDTDDTDGDPHSQTHGNPYPQTDADPHSCQGLHKPGQQTG
jgi:hypothetical protein